MSFQKALLTDLIDYAGLFPPAGLAMGPAVEEYARVRASDDAWILARFIVPVARLEEFEEAAADFLSESDPWPLSALSGKDPQADRDAIDAFHQRQPGARVEAIETRASTPEQIAEKASIFEEFELYLEIPHQDDPTPLMEEILRAGARAKIRTGGVTEDLLAPATEVARFLAAAARTGVSLKATAGLHHPLRGEYRLTYEADSGLGTMHGFVNLFTAAAFAYSGQLEEKELVDLLEERDADAFHSKDDTSEEDTIRWREHTVDSATLAATRKKFIGSFGSCSFREPVEEIQHLGIL